MIKPEQMPSAALKAGKAAAALKVFHLTREMTSRRLTDGEIEQFMEQIGPAVFLAMIEAWPGMWTSNSVGNGSLILPLTQEQTDDGALARAALGEATFTEGHCKDKKAPGGCQLHNLQCSYPDCDRRPIGVQR